MKKILHLVCNSHIDPVWQWDWDEGVSATLATFYAACNLLDQYDFIFCHNEAILYEYVEKYDPELFKRIKKLVAEGKWKIMGGWYIQPDCLVPSGESFIRQASLGREYFGEKFNVRPTTALNLDSFGHTRGLPQILKKCGFDSYVFCRPLLVVHNMHDVDMPHGPYLWEGYDGSRVKALRYEDSEANYTARYGFAREDIERKSNYYKDQDIRVALWGVGNHGGVNSGKDLEDIMQLMKDEEGKFVIKHSTLEDYFKEVGEPTNVDDRQYLALIKSYSSIHSIKYEHDRLENALYFTEKVCTATELSGKYRYNKQILKDAERVLCQIEFHDVLSGTAIKTGNDSSIMKVHHALDELKKEMYAAFVAMCKDLPEVTPEDENMVVFNPFPYEFNDFIETEVYPLKACLDNDQFEIKVYDMNGNPVEFQMIHEESLIYHQKRVRLIYKAKVPAFSVASFGVHFELVEKKPKVYDAEHDICYEDSRKKVKISRNSGLLESFEVDGVEYLNGPLAMPATYNDNPDPWGWRINNLTDQIYNECGWPVGVGKSTLKDFKLDKSSKGLYEGLKAVTILEQGDILTEVQSLFSKGESHVVINYKIYKDKPTIDMNVHVLFNEHGKGLKIKFPLKGSRSYFAQMAFGIEHYKDDKEYPCNRYVGVKNGDKCFVIYNKSGIHSVAKKGKYIGLTLLNGSAYCSHPTRSYNPMVVDTTRFVPYIEQGAHDFAFRLQVNKYEECERYAKEFNEAPYSILFFPHGDGDNISKDVITLSNKNIIISALKRRNNDEYIIRLYNGKEKKDSTDLCIKGIQKHIVFNKFEFKTFVFDGKHIQESEDASIY